MLTKVELRKKLIHQRKLVSPEERQNASHAASKIISEESVFKNSHHIACYLATDQEFDCHAIIQLIWQLQKNCYLPLLTEPEEKSLEFAKYQPDTILQLNRYQILEPQSEKKIFPASLDLVFVPLVAVDKKGNRLGMGGGYYDRTFQFLLKNKVKKPVLIGLAYEFQVIEELPLEEWDVPLQGVLTERGWSSWVSSINIKQGKGGK